uniref:ALMS1 centrosome and basal body associated protein n=1 Tax=Catagonus wagneri TaxID=51154 RepID=A0A8C3WT53_9CETA
MEPEDLRWPGELEEEEEEAENLDEDEVVMVEEMEEEAGRGLDAELNCGSQRRESTDDEDDEEAKAWLQEHPSGALPQPPLPRHRCSKGELTSPKIVPLTCHVWQQPSYQDNSETQVSDMTVVSLEQKAQWGSGDDQRTETWHCLPQEMDSSHTLDTTQTRFNVREKGTEVTNFPSLEEGISTQSENQVKEPSRSLLCSPLLVIQDNFASPDLPLLTCLTKEQEFGLDSLFHQSEQDFAPLRGIPGKSEDTEWFSRPSEVSEALFQAASEVASDLISCSVSQHPLIGSEAESWRSLLTPEERTKEETVASDTLDELKTCEDFDSNDALCSYMSWKTQVIQEPETNLADKNQVSFSTASDTSDEYLTPKGSDRFDASCSYVQFWKQEALQQSEKYLTSKDHDSYSNSSDLIDKSKIPKGSDNFSAPFSCMPWSKQGASHHPEIGLISKDRVSFLHEVTAPFNNKMSRSFLPCFLERGGRGVPLTSDGHYLKSVYLRAPTESEVKQQTDSLDGYERTEEDLGKELSHCFELKENRNTLMFSDIHPRSSEIQYIENVSDNSVKVSERHTLCRGHDTSVIEVSVGPLQTSKSNSDETAEQLYFQDEKNQKATPAFGGKNVDVTENVAFQAIIASIEPSEKESTISEIQTDISKSSTKDSQEREQKNPDLFPLNYDENSFLDKLNHPRYKSTPGVFESVASKPSLYKKDDGDSTLYWHPDLKSLPSAPQEMFVKPVSLIPELKSSSLSEKSVRQAVGLDKYDRDSEPFLPSGETKSVSALDLAEKLGSSNIIYPMKVWISDSLVLQELKPQTFEEVADSSNYIFGKNVNSSNIIEGPSAAVRGSFSANLVACDAKSQGGLPVISDASTAVGQETLLKADIGQGEIPQPLGAKSSFTIHTVMQTDSYFVEGLQGKAESDICTLDDAAECCSLDENAVVCSKRVPELQREICDQGDLTSECTELAGLENLLDDLEVCDSSLHWQSTVQLPSKEESSCEVPVGPSNTDINQSSSVLPPFVPHEPARELEYHSSDLRMLRVSPDFVPGTLKHLTGDTSKGGVLEIPQSTLKPGITTTPEDSDTRFHLSLSPEGFPHLALRSQVKNIDRYTDTLNQQTLADKPLTEETLKISTVPGLGDQKTGIPPSSYLLGEKNSIFYPQALPDGHLPEEALKASVLPLPADQKTGIPTVPAGSYSVGEKTGIFYQQGLPGSHLLEEALKVSVLPGPADQKTVLPTASSAYSHGEKPRIFYQQTLPESHLTEQAVKVSAAPGSPEQKTAIPTIPSTSYSHREKPSILYQQELPDSHLTEQAQKISAVPGLAEQKTGISTVPSASCPHEEKPGILYQQELLDNHLIQQIQQVSAAPGLAEQKIGILTVSSSSYSPREKLSILYQQELPDSHLIQQIQQVSAAPVPPEQKTGFPTIPSTSYSHGEKPSILYQQELPDSHLIQQIHQVSAAPGLAEQKTGIPTVPSTSYSHQETPRVFYQQELPDSRVTEQAQKVSAAPGLGEQKTEISTVPSSSYSYREKPGILYQQELPDSHLTEQSEKVSAIPGLAEQKTGISTVPSASYPHREKPSILYQQEFPESRPIEQAQQVSAAPGPPEQKVGFPTIPSISYSPQETPHIFYQQELPDSHLTEQAQQVSAAPGLAEQKTGVLTIPYTSYSHREKPSIFYRQDLPSSHLTKAQKVPADPGLAHQKSGIPIAPPAFYSQRGKTSLFYQQELPDSHLSDQTQKISAISGPVDQNTGIQTVPSSSYSHREKPSIFYQQGLPDSHLTEEALKVSAIPRIIDQNTGIPTRSSRSYSFGEKPDSIFYQQVLPGGHLTEEALKVSSASRLSDQKTGILSVPASSYSYRERPSIFSPQPLPGSHPSEEALKDSASPGLADQKTRTLEPSSSDLHREKSSIFYQQELPDSHLAGETLKFSGVSGPGDQKTGIPIVRSSSYSYREKPIVSYQRELPDLTQVALKVLEVPGLADETIGIPAEPSAPYSHGEKPIISYQKELAEPNEDALTYMGVSGQADKTTGIQIVPPASYSHRESPLFPYQKELPDLTEEALKVSAVPGLADQKIGIQIVPPGSHSYGEKANVFYQQELPDITEEALKVFALPGPADRSNEIPIGPSGSYSQKEKLKILPDDQKTELPSAPPSSYSHREKPKTSTVIGPDDQKTPLLTGVPNSYSQRVNPSIFYEQQLPDRHQSGDILEISPVAEPTDGNSQIPIPLSSSYSHREKSNIFYPEELPDKHLTGDALKVSTIPGSADQKTVLPSVPSSSFSCREKPVIFYQQDLPERHLTEDNLKFSSSLGQADQITGLSTVSSGTYLHSEKHELVSGHVQRLIDKLDSPNSSVISNNMPLNSQADGRVVINKTESLGFEGVGSEEVRGTENSSRTLKEIQTLLMEAENIALRRCNFPVPVPLVPFRDVNDISFIKSKKVVCFKEPPTTDESNGDLSQRQIAEESPSNKYVQKDISTQTNMKCQRSTENWEFIASTTVRNPLQEAESKARVALDETLSQCKAAKSVMRSEPEGYSGTFGNKILIPMMTIIKSDSSSDASSCSWDSNSLESVSDVLLNFFPCSTPKTSMTDSREEECVLESDDGGGSSVDSLAAHVKNLLQCESSLNHAKQILRNAEEEESRVRARAWNLKFNMAHECGYSISELNEDDRRKVEEIKAKLFGHGRTTDLSEGLQSPRGIGCKPEAVCSHIIIESHEKGCFRTLTAERPQLDSRPYVFRSADPSEMIRGQRCPSTWRNRHINLSKSLDQSNSHFKVWNSLELQSPSPFQNLIADDLKITKGLRMPFREKLDPWLSELEPASMPPEEMDCHSSSQMLPPEPMKKFTTSITFSSHRHSKCFSDSSFLKVGVTEGSQCTGASLGVFNSHFTEEQNPPRDLKQENSFPSSFKIISQSPDKAMTILAENSRQGQKLSVERSHQEEKLLERSDFKGSHSKPGTSAHDSSFKEVHFSDNSTLISMGRPSSTLEVIEKNVTVTPDLPSHIFLEQELSEKAPHADHHVRKHHFPPSQHQDYVAPNLPCRIFLEKRELFKQSKAPHVDHQMRENHSPLPQSQNFIAPDLPSSIFLEQRQLLEQSKTPDVDHHMRKQHSPLPQGQDYVVEKNNQQKPKLHISDMINVEAKFSDVVSPSAPVVTSASTPPSNRKALSCIRITLCPKTPSKLDSETLDKRFHSLDPASKTTMNSEFNSDLQTVSSRSLEPTAKLLTSKPIAQDQASLGFLGPKSSPDFQVVQSPLPDSNITQDLKTIPFQNSQIVTSRQTQVNISDLEDCSNPEGTPVSADRSPEQIKTSLSAFSGKLSSDAVTQITTESPGKAIFSSEIFVNAEDRGHEIPELTTQKVGKGPIQFASSSSVQQITVPHSIDVQPSLLPYKPSGSTKMYYVPQLSQIPSSLDSKSDTTIESSHSGSNDAIAPDFPAQVLGTRDDDLADTVNIKHKEGIYSKRAVTKASLFVGKKPLQKDNADAQVQVFIAGNEEPSDENQKKEISSERLVSKAAQSEEKEPLLKDTADASTAAASEYSTQLQNSKIDNVPAIKAIKQKEEMHSKKTVPKEAWPEEKKSLQIDIAESRCHSEFENTTHSVFRSAKFYFHHPVHLPNDQDFCHESLGKSVFMKHSWKDFFQHHPDKEREQTFLPPPYQNMEKTKTDYTRIESLSINVNLENKEVKHTPKSQARDFPKCDKQVNDPNRDQKSTAELTTQHAVSLNELWSKYQERQKQQKPPEVSAKEELSLVERLDRLAKLLQRPITHSLQPSESTQDDSRGEQEVKEWSRRQQQQKNKLQKKKRYKSLEKCHKNTGDLKKNRVLSTHQPVRSNQIKIEQIKFDKYILRKQPGVRYINNTSSDSRHSEESELLTDTPSNILSTTTSVESDILAQTDKEVTLHERSSSISTIDTARLIHAFGHERVCLSPRRIKLYSSITDHQRRYLEKRSKKNKKALNAGYPQITSEHTRRKHIQVTDCISSDSISSTTSFWSSSSTLCNKQNAHMLNKGIQAGNLEIVNGVRKHTRDVGMTFPTPSSSEARVEEDSDVTSSSEEKIEEKRIPTSYLGDKKLRKNKQNCCEGVSWFVPVENVKSGPKKENLPKFQGPGISWFAPITNTKPWREPLREQNWQEQHMLSHGSLAGPGRHALKPFVRATLQEALQLHRPDFISRSGERIKRLKLIVQERKLQNVLQSEREALFNTVQEWQGCRDPMHELPKRGTPCLSEPPLRPTPQLTVTPDP